jgi:hypothetical protein
VRSWLHLLPPLRPPLRPPALERPRLPDAAARWDPEGFLNAFELLGARAAGARVVVGRDTCEARFVVARLVAAGRDEADGSVPAEGREVEGRETDGRVAGRVATPPPIA